MRNSMFGYSFMFAAAMIGCGGDDDGNATPDAKVFMDAAIDAPPLVTCTVMSQTQALGLGSAQMRQVNDFIINPTTGPQMGKTVFLLAAGLPGSTMTLADVLAIEVVKPAGGWQTNTAIAFDPSPTNAAYVAASYIFEDYVPMSNPLQYSRFLYASNGSVTFSAINDTQGSLITGMAAATNFREVNEMTGADVAGGCTVSLAGLNFALQHMNAAMRTQSPSAWSEGGVMTLTPEDMGAIGTLIEDIKSKQAQQ